MPIFLAGASTSSALTAEGAAFFGAMAGGLLLTVAGFVLLVAGRRSLAALALGLGSLAGYFLPFLLVPAVTAVYLGVRQLRERRGGFDGVAAAGAGLGVVGSLLSLAFPAIIAIGLVYALTHGGRLPY